MSSKYNTEHECLICFDSIQNARDKVQCLTCNKIVHYKCFNKWNKTKQLYLKIGAGSGVAGSGVAGSEVAGSEVAGSGVAGSGVAGSEVCIHCQQPHILIKKRSILSRCCPWFL